MKKSVYFENCLREIRQTVYGRDMRKPLADAIEYVKKSHRDANIQRLVRTETELNTDIIDWIERVGHIVYVNFEAGNTYPTYLTPTLISGDDYLLVDARTSDTVSLISGQDYLMTAGDSRWTVTGLDAGSYVEYEYIPHHETYFLVLKAAGEQ